MPTAQPMLGYEVYPGCTAERFVREYLQAKQITIESFCMQHRITPDEFKRIVYSVVTDWDMKERVHRDRSDALNHLVNHINCKLSAERNNQSRQIRPSARPNQDADERMARIAQELLRQSSGRNQP